MRLVILVVLVSLVLVGGLTAALIAPDEPLTARTIDANVTNDTGPIDVGSVPLSAGRLVRADLIIE